MGEKLIQKASFSKYLIAGLVSLLTFLVYLPSLQNKFVCWDDAAYVTNNALIRSFNLRLIKSAFLEFHAANWHPLTWISHALDYAVWGLNPAGHHLTNNIVHATNSFLVVILTINLLEVYKARVDRDDSTTFIDLPGMLLVGGFTGLLFGLHPLHVESVVWVAERKDLLCALFFMLSVIVYLKYVFGISRNSESLFPCNNKLYLMSLGFFTLALLSKPMAVSLPVVLLILDWFPSQRIRSLLAFRNALIEKAPFVALSLLSSIVTIQAQKAGGAMQLVKIVPLSTRLLVAARSLFAYIWKILLPLKLLPFYPYPRDVSLPSAEYLFIFTLVFVSTVTCIVISRSQKLWFSLSAYYVVTLMPVLGIVQVGAQAMADRYMYLPSLGPFLIAGSALTWILINVAKLRKGQRLLINVFCTAILFLMFAAMSALTIRQIGIWRNDIDLWNYVIEKTPTSDTFAYFKRGMAYEAAGQFDKALADYDRIIALEPYHADAYFSRGLLFAKTGQFVRAINEYDHAIIWNQYGAGSVVGRKNYFLYRGCAYFELGQIQSAILDYRKACELGSQLGCNNLKSMSSLRADPIR